MASADSLTLWLKPAGCAAAVEFFTPVLLNYFKLNTGEE